MTDAVADAGPILHLHEIDSLSLLEVFNTITVSTAVWQECTVPGRVQPQSLAMLRAIRQQDVEEKALEEFTVANNLSALQRGELEALHLCEMLGVPTMLTDDLAARNAAKSLNLRPVGSLGILIRACRKDMISLADAEGLLWQLFDRSSLFVTRAIVETAIVQLRQFKEDQ